MSQHDEQPLKLLEIRPQGVYNKLEIDRETAHELLRVLDHQYVNPEYEKVHDLIKRMWVFVGYKK